MLVCDNASTDDTEDVVGHFTDTVYPVNYIKHNKNIGSDANFAECFNRSKGNYFLLLGDDDVFIQDKFKRLMSFLILAGGGSPGAIYLPAYAYLDSFDEDPPMSRCRDEILDNRQFLIRVVHRLTFISSFVINRNLIKEYDAYDFVGQNLVQVHWLLLVTMRATHSVLFADLMLSCERSSSPNFDYSGVFVKSLNEIFEKYLANDKKLKNRLIYKSFMFLIPSLITRQRLSSDCGMMHVHVCLLKFLKPYKGLALLYRLFVSPIIWLPRYLSIIYGLLLTLLLKLYVSDFNIILFYIVHKIKRCLRCG